MIFIWKVERRSTIIRNYLLLLKTKSTATLITIIIHIAKKNIRKKIIYISIINNYDNSYFQDLVNCRFELYSNEYIFGFFLPRYIFSCLIYLQNNIFYFLEYCIPSIQLEETIIFNQIYGKATCLFIFFLQYLFINFTP